MVVANRLDERYIKLYVLTGTDESQTESVSIGEYDNIEEPLVNILIKAFETVS